jgi:hypothetical protein
MVLAIPTVLLLTALFLCGILHIVDAAKNISHIDVRKAPLKNSKELQIYPAVGGADTFDVALMQPVLNLDREDSVEGLPAENLGRLVQGTYSYDRTLLWRANKIGPVDLVSVARLLRYHYANGFCRGFCPGYTTPYIKKTRFKSTTKFVKTVTTSCMGGCELQTTTTTVTENAPPDVTVTETTTASATITTTLAAQTQTITTTETVRSVFEVTKGLSTNSFLGAGDHDADNHNNRNGYSRTYTYT